MFPVGKGSKGSDVKKVQIAILKGGIALPRYGADGGFGSETAAALTKFQKKFALDVSSTVTEFDYEAMLMALDEYHPASSAIPSRVVHSVSANSKAVSMLSKIKAFRPTKKQAMFGIGAVGVLAASFIFYKQVYSK